MNCNAALDDWTRWMDQSREYVITPEIPSLDEIEKRKAEIQAGWNDRTRRERETIGAKAWAVPNVSGDARDGQPSK